MMQIEKERFKGSNRREEGKARSERRWKAGIDPGCGNKGEIYKSADSASNTATGHMDAASAALLANTAPFRGYLLFSYCMCEPQGRFVERVRARG
jgi:hypothetical protein